jgi:1-acyl-sn-glycerol-3-phosphate acyltransferase
MAESTKTTRPKSARRKSTRARRDGKSKPIEEPTSSKDGDYSVPPKDGDYSVPPKDGDYSVKPKRRRAKRQPEVEEPVAEAEPVVDAPDASLQQRFLQEVDELIKRLKAIHPGYNPPPFIPEGIATVVGQTAAEISPGLLDKIKKFVGEDMFDMDTWKGLWYMISSSTQMQADTLARRLTGEYDTDEWGFDREYFEAVRPFFEFLYRTYWRVSLSGVENIPESGRALLVVNHSGQLPFDGAMVGAGVLLEHPAQRLVRTLYATWFPSLPFLSDLLVKMGQALATEDNGVRLLEEEELVAVFPEGYKGVGKLYKDRYKLARFGRGGFVRMALKTKAPMIPVSVVGAEETYISLAKSDVMAKITGMPYFPISPTFPWLGLLGFVPLPTKWYIDIGEPIPMDGYPPKSEQNLMLVQQLTDQTRNIVQNMILKRLAQRRSVFLG